MNCNMKFRARNMIETRLSVNGFSWYFFSSIILCFLWNLRRDFLFVFSVLMRMNRCSATCRSRTPNKNKTWTKRRLTSNRSRIPTTRNHTTLIKSKNEKTTQQQQNHHEVPSSHPFDSSSSHSDASRFAFC